MRPGSPAFAGRTEQVYLFNLHGVSGSSSPSVSSVLVRCRKPSIGALAMTAEGVGQEHRLPHLLIPTPHAHGEPFVAIEAGIAEDERPLLVELGRARSQRCLHHHLDRDPGRPVGALHAPSAARPIETRIDLRPAIVFPGPVPADRLEIDRAHHGPRLHSLKRHLAGKLEGVVGDEDHVVVAGAGGEQQRIVQLALARIGAGLECPYWR